MNIQGLEFNLTCGACPEQYDVTYCGEQVAYVRLRYGHLYASFPDIGGNVIYDHYYDDGWLGLFPDHEDRELHLNNIATKINEVLDI